MARIASVKETGEEVSQAEWMQFEQAVRVEVESRRDHDTARDDRQVEPDPQQADVKPL